MSETSLRGGHRDHQILVVGADGMLGSRLVTAFEREGTSVWGSTRSRASAVGKRVFLDLADNVRHFEPPFSGPGTAILCAAHTSIDECRREPRATRRINVENTVALAQCFVSAGLFVVFLSSNTVFDGSKAFAGAGENLNPQHEYGRQKADAEDQMLSFGANAAVIRFTKIIAPDMPLLRGWLLNMSAGEPVYPFSDAVMAPLSADFATELIHRVVEVKRAGVTQASASKDISYADAASYLATKIAVDVNLVKPVSCRNAGGFPFPIHTTLDTTSLREIGLDAPLPTNVLDHFV